MKEAERHLSNAEQHLGSIQIGEKDPAILQRAVRDIWECLRAHHVELELLRKERDDLVERVKAVESIGEI